MMNDLHVPLHDNTKFFVNSGIMKQVGLSNLFTKEMKIHPNMVGLIIGRKGAMIKKLEKFSRANLKVETDDTGEKTLIIMGNLESVCLAEMLVIEEIKKANKTQPAKIMRLPKPQGPDIVTEKFPIPVDKCGIIIGKRGVTIKQIQVISKCHIELYRQQEPNANELLIIKGPRKQIPYAKKLITKKIKPQFGNFGYEENTPIKQRGQSNHYYALDHTPRTIYSI
jgi:far upstream element-binding protein